MMERWRSFDEQISLPNERDALEADPSSTSPNPRSCSRGFPYFRDPRSASTFSLSKARPAVWESFRPACTRAATAVLQIPQLGETVSKLDPAAIPPTAVGGLFKPGLRRRDPLPPSSCSFEESTLAPPRGREAARELMPVEQEMRRCRGR
jgi:hypothetical protein